MIRTPFEQATIFLSVGRYRRAAEIMLQIIMEQEGRLRVVEKRLPEREVNFTDGLEGGTDYCPHCKSPCKRNFCIYCGADFERCECENKTINNMVKQYRKKPIVVEAIQFKGNFEEIECFVGGDAEFRSGELIVATLEGPLRASRLDWIIKGVNGEFYPCKPDIFEKTYELVTEL